MNLRLGFIVISILIFFFFPVYLLQAAARILIFLVISSWILSAIPRHFLTVHIEKPVLRSFLHERTTVKIRIFNNSYIPLFNVGLKDASGGLSIEGKNSLVTFIPAKTQITLEYKIWSIHRGLFKLGPLQIIGTDPFGLFPWSQQFVLERLVFIYPHVVPMELTASHGLTGGPIQSRHPMYLDTTQIRSIREYRTGDDTRHIHWKASAVHGNIMISEYAKTLTIPFYVILNLRKEDFGQKRRSYHVERCIEAAAAFIELSNYRNYSLGFLTNGHIPVETRKYLGLDENTDLPCYHQAITSAQSSASNLLSLLSVIQEKPEKSDLSEISQHLVFNLAPRILVITPSFNEEDFLKLVSMVPRTCRMDFWFLEEHQHKEGCVDHRSLPPRPRITMFKLPEYGEDLLKEESGHV